MRANLLVGLVALSVVVAGCATGRVAYRYEHPTKKTFGERNGDFAACQFATGVSEGDRFTACMVKRGYSPIYAD